MRVKECCSVSGEVRYVCGVSEKERKGGSVGGVWCEGKASVPFKAQSLAVS